MFQECRGACSLLMVRVDSFTFRAIGVIASGTGCSTECVHPFSKKTSGLLGLCTLNKSLSAAFNSANEGCWFFWFKILDKVCSDVISLALDATQKYHCVFVRVHQPSLSFIIGSWFYNSVRGRGIWKDAAIFICLVQQTLDGPKSPWSPQEGAAQNQNKERRQIYKAFSNPLWQMC